MLRVGQRHDSLCHAVLYYYMMLLPDCVIIGTV